MIIGKKLQFGAKVWWQFTSDISSVKGLRRGVERYFLLIARHEAEKSQNLLFVIFKNIIS